MGLFTKNKAKQKLTKVLKGTNPPHFRPGVTKLLQLLRDPDSEIGHITSALEWDPGLVVRVLKTVNSAAFGLSQRVDRVQHAVAILGRAKVEQIVLGVAVKDSLPTKPVPGFDSTRFWQAAFFRAALARTIAGQLHPADEARSFTGALLQDMAVPLVAHARPDDYGKVLQEWHGSPEVKLHELEKQTFGWSHDEIGGHLAVDWELPERLTQVIHGHHDNHLPDSELPPALRLVAVFRETENEHGIDGLIEDAGSMYGLQSDWMREAIDQSQSQARELSDSF